MRAMPIRIVTGKGPKEQMVASFKKNWKHYLQEALGLAIFMVSACFFGALLESDHSVIHLAIHDRFFRMLIMSIMMGSTALFIFYLPITASSGSHINPAVTLTFLRLNKICPYDALFFILFQCIGGTIAVYCMQFILGNMLTEAPVNTIATVPGKQGAWPTLIIEFSIAFITIIMVLFTSGNKRLKKYTRLFAALLVAAWVLIAGPVSGFGMNPARTLASALPSHTWTSFWIYLLMPVAGMLAAAELYLWIERSRSKISSPKEVMPSTRKKFMEPFEFMI